MKVLVDHIEGVLSAWGEGGAVDEALLAAAFLFEKATLSYSGDMGWTDEVVNAVVDNAEVERLKGVLVRFIEAGGKGAWALGKSLDARMKGVFVGILKREFRGDMGELYQAMIALDNIGEPIFQELTSMSIIESELNRRLVLEYLER